MKNMSAWAIRHPVSPVVLFVVLLFMGVVAFVRLPITLNPDIAYPIVHVTVSQPGAAPQEIETQVLQKIEGSVAGIGNIHNITSLALEGVSSTWIEFQIGTPIDRAVADVRDAVAKVRSNLPNGIQEPIVQRVDVDGGPIAYYAVATTSETQEQLSWFVDNAVTKRLLAIQGVAQVFRGGGVNREIRVELDPARMQALGITAVDVNQQLRTLNLDSPGGRAQLGGGEQSIRVLGGAHTALALGDTQIALPGTGGRFARLSDIANVHDGVGEIRSMARLNGREATTFGIAKAKGSSDVTVLAAVERELEKVGKENPQVTMTKVFTTVDYTKQQYHSALSAFIEGSILAVIVVWFFLRDMRATAISALAIPLSAIPSFAFMQMMGFSLNNISLLALSLVAGVLVDDAIVEIENIVRHMRMGKSGFQAALDAADQIGLAVVATSCTIMAVFLPVSFMPGITGQYFIQFGLTVAAAVFFSLLVARLITPVIAAYMLKSERVAVHTDGPFMSGYMRTLNWCIHNRWKTIGGGMLFFLLSIAGLALIPKSFIPDADLGAPDLAIELPTGVRLEDTAAVSAAAYRIIARQPEVANVVESIGEDEEIRTGQLYIQLVPRNQRKVTQKEWEDRVIKELRTIPDAEIHFNKNGGNGGGRDVNIYI
ncbi:MAG: AcrB/AcrD/AcrF family protein, partial [Gammaproteobacteria bacterium]|nr:AcrB/AcrD/AcrF family protein [Gammaproteobacteria bacterium]